LVSVAGKIRGNRVRSELQTGAFLKKRIHKKPAIKNRQSFFLLGTEQRRNDFQGGFWTGKGMECPGTTGTPRGGCRSFSGYKFFLKFSLLINMGELAVVPRLYELPGRLLLLTDYFS